MRIVSSPLSSAIDSALHTVIDPWVGGGSGPPAFNPDSLFGANDGGGVIAARDTGLCLFQDAAGTVPVTAVGQTVLSVRARNRPAFLMVWDPVGSTVEATYELDPQGYPAIKAGPSATGGWAYFRKRDGGLPVTSFSIVLSAMGAYRPDQTGVGTGWSVMGDADDTFEPYSYSGVYTTITEDAAEMRLTLADAPTLYEVPIAENIDMRPYVFSSRMSDGDSRFQVNLESAFDYPGPVAPFSTPVGVDFWVSAGDYWYGGVFITRDLDDEENYDTQVWCGDLAGITLVGPKPFYPLDLFLPGDRGLFADPNRISILFQARTGPTNPVTSPGQGVGWIANEHNSAFSLQRGVANSNYTYAGPGKLVGVASDTLTTQFSTPVFPGVTECTFAQAGFAKLPEMRTGANHAVSSFGPHNLSLADGVQIFVQIGVSTNRMQAQAAVVGSIGAINNIPDSEFDGAYVAGGVYDFAAGAQNQYTFFNDLDVTALGEVLPPTSGFRVGTSIWANANGLPYWNSAMFFIDRKLSSTELAQLKTWMRDNTPTS
jgi:hypothetical protein